MRLRFALKAAAATCGTFATYSTLRSCQVWSRVTINTTSMRIQLLIITRPIQPLALSPLPRFSAGTGLTAVCFNHILSSNFFELVYEQLYYCCGAVPRSHKQTGLYLCLVRDILISDIIVWNSYLVTHAKDFRRLVRARFTILMVFVAMSLLSRCWPFVHRHSSLLIVYMVAIRQYLVQVPKGLALQQ